MSRFTKEWMLIGGKRLLTVCFNGIPMQPVSRWLVSVANRSSSPETPKTYAFNIYYFFLFLEKQNMTLDDIDERAVERFWAMLDYTDEDDDYLFSKSAISDSTKNDVISATCLFLKDYLLATNCNPQLLKKLDRRFFRHPAKGMLAGIRDQGSRERSPFRKKEKKKLPKHFSVKQIALLRQWIDTTWKDQEDLRVRNRLIFELLYDGALRRGEVESVLMDNLDFAERWIKIQFLEEEYQRGWETGHISATQKSGERVISVSPETMELIEDYLKHHRPIEASKLGHGRLLCIHATRGKGKPITKDAITHIFKKANRTPLQGGCNVGDRVHPHKLRHSFATHALDDGVSEKAIQDQLGHKNPDTTRIYEHVTPARGKKLLDHHRELKKERYEN